MKCFEVFKSFKYDWMDPFLEVFILLEHLALLKMNNFFSSGPTSESRANYTPLSSFKLVPKAFIASNGQSHGGRVEVTVLMANRLFIFIKSTLVHI